MPSHDQHDPPRMFDAVVESTGFVTPSMIRVRFGGTALRSFETTGVPDERLRLLFGDGEHQVLRSYTVRAFDAHGPHLDVDFVVHDGGVAADWALRAEPGDHLTVSEARGWYAPPRDSRWQLLVADMTALPALTRAVEQLPEATRAFVIAAVPGPADEQEVPTRGDVTYTWWHTGLSGAPGTDGPSPLVDAVRAFDLPDGPGYVWAACESSEARSVRRYFHRELCWSPGTFEIKGYWRRDRERWQRRYAQVEDQITAVRDRALAGGASGLELTEIVDDALERSGL